MRQDMLEIAGEVDRKATECVYAGGKEIVENGPDSADMEEERGCASHSQTSTETVGEGFRRKDQEKSRK